MRKQEVCYCEAYEFPHRKKGGLCTEGEEPSEGDEMEEHYKADLKERLRDVKATMSHYSTIYV